MRPERRPTWNMHGLMVSLKDFREASQPEEEWGATHGVLGVSSSES